MRDPMRPHSSALNRHIRKPRGHPDTCGASRRASPSATATPVALSIALSPCGWPSICALTTTQSRPRPGKSAISVRVRARWSSPSMTRRAVGSVPSGEPRNDVRRFGTNAECRDAGAAVASTRPRYRADAWFRMGDQKPGRAHLLRQSELDAAVHVPGRERIFVADHDDAAADARSRAARNPQVGPSRDRGLPLRRPPPMPCPEVACIGTKRPSSRWSVAPSGTANPDIPRDHREPLRPARPRAAAGRRSEPRLRSPSRRGGRPDRTAPGSPPTSAGRWDLPVARADAPSMRRPSRDADPDRLDDIGPARRVALDQGSELRG